MTMKQIRTAKPMTMMGELFFYSMFVILLWAYPGKIFRRLSGSGKRRNLKQKATTCAGGL
jgi:hypothetical protein